ncbi:simple sugar transport system permease protein/ribose transport system permease protein [Peteryoungia aggregata LMG 23059]|uniref:Simple sugar transport system permease protein/ribose transport system permease protein n=1 Tax=Peteryoungia aggregata LMG 23059 TaxID=1368425 RepID=A0ABU0G5N0_9HYPH|nr:ABC transporter permease [Peteryoungia aggregata]MDQ0420249.1 simple sugar transport system permease protein/ribose transport system permease protein [Peteryoungia aggregata LMG 23059]
MTRSGNTFATFARRNSMLIILIALYILVALTARGFMSIDNQLNILRTIAVPGMIAFGMTLLIIVGEIDLSVGSMVAASACVLAWLVSLISGGAFEPGVWHVILAGLLTLGFGASVGMFNGWLRNRFMVPTFISSLAMMATLAGLANLITDGTPIESFPSWYYFIGSGRIFHVPFPVYLLLMAFVVTHVLANYTSFGRSVYAIGGNAEAARLSGLHVNRTRTWCLVITSLFAVVGGIVYSSLLNSGNPTIAKGMELEVISAVIIGGVSLFGGKGSIWGAFVGVLFLGVLLNAMTLWGFNPYAQQVVRGVLILGAVFINLIIDRPKASHG